MLTIGKRYFEVGQQYFRDYSAPLIAKAGGLLTQAREYVSPQKPDTTITYEATLSNGRKVALPVGTRDGNEKTARELSIAHKALRNQQSYCQNVSRVVSGAFVGALSQYGWSSGYSLLSLAAVPVICCAAYYKVNQFITAHFQPQINTLGTGIDIVLTRN